MPVLAASRGRRTPINTCAQPAAAPRWIVLAVAVAISITFTLNSSVFFLEDGAPGDPAPRAHGSVPATLGGHPAHTSLVEGHQEDRDEAEVLAAARVLAPSYLQLPVQSQAWPLPLPCPKNSRAVLAGECVCSPGHHHRHAHSRTTLQNKTANGRSNPLTCIGAPQ